MGINHDHRSTAVDDSVLLTEDEAAHLLKIQPATLATWRVRGHPHLPFVRVGRCIRYRRQDITTFINGHLTAPAGKGQA